ncbi:uncharacterized protein BDR25DRAFT_356767 [Lindgomyces ingoldianus]|uniref:Uncharacterized protein n=1 Tax=Lindgomyces ingoldianus TaxID=673940 RepID=A0ACB6QSD7_9PLEO|nr:uncharacterized protein BDR25DRAFT_356767 [Lindgomyces ingoldianus]KAF2468997.1 hypothetical protein BDR25DRAFT_356767 [Lindgomyces ingoldianus]
MKYVTPFSSHAMSHSMPKTASIPPLLVAPVDTQKHTAIEWLDVIELHSHHITATVVRLCFRLYVYIFGFIAGHAVSRDVHDCHYDFPSYLIRAQFLVSLFQEDFTKTTTGLGLATWMKAFGSGSRSTSVNHQHIVSSNRRSASVDATLNTLTNDFSAPHCINSTTSISTGQLIEMRAEVSLTQWNQGGEKVFHNIHILHSFTEITNFSRPECSGRRMEKTLQRIRELALGPSGGDEVQLQQYSGLQVIIGFAIYPSIAVTSAAKMAHDREYLFRNYDHPHQSPSCASEDNQLHKGNCVLVEFAYAPSSKGYQRNLYPFHHPETASEPDKVFEYELAKPPRVIQIKTAMYITILSGLLYNTSSIYLLFLHGPGSFKLSPASWTAPFPYHESTETKAVRLNCLIERARSMGESFNQFALEIDGSTLNGTKLYMMLDVWRIAIPEEQLDATSLPNPSPTENSAISAFSLTTSSMGHQTSPPGSTPSTSSFLPTLNLATFIFAFEELEKSTLEGIMPGFLFVHNPFKPFTEQISPHMV